jgi:hypothetical protein
MQKWAWVGLGCLAVPIVLVLCLVVLVGVGVMAGRSDAEWVDRHVTVELPAKTGPVRVTVELADGEFVVRPGAAKGTVSVDAHFDETHHALEVTGPSEVRDTGALHISLEPVGLQIARGLDAGNRVEVSLPTDVTLDLSARVARGETAMELGGLALASLELDSQMGECDASFSAPNPVEMSRMALSGSMGELTVTGAGRARPAVVEASGKMGELLLDLGGLPAGPVSVDASMSMGGMVLELPPDALRASRRSHAKFASTRFSHPLPPASEATGTPAVPVLALTTEVSMGELIVRTSGDVPHRGALSGAPLSGAR